MTCNCMGCPHPANCRCRCDKCHADTIQMFDAFKSANKNRLLQKAIDVFESEMGFEDCPDAVEIVADMKEELNK